MKKFLFILFFVLSGCSLRYGNIDNNMKNNEIDDWKEKKHNIFDFSISYPVDCSLEFLAENPYDKEKRYFVLNCENEKEIIDSAFILTGVVDNYIEDRKMGGEVIYEQEKIGEKILQILEKENNKEQIVTFVISNDSNVVLEIYGPKSGEDEDIDTYKKVINFSEFF